MFKKIFKFSKEEVVKGSLILFVMINVFNFLNYVFHFSMARMLKSENYGILAVLMSIVYIFSIPAEGIQTIISRYTSTYNIKQEYGKIKYLLFKSIRKIGIISIFLFLAYVPTALILGYFTKINSSLIAFTGILIFGILIIPVTRGVLQGRKKFKSLGWNMIFESIFKLALAVIFVLLGFKVYGAISGVILGLLLALLFSFFLIKEVLNAEIKKTKIEKIYSYSFPVFIVMFTVIFMVSIDIILARAFFPADLAGKYAVASMLGKMIFFGTAGISKAMFPLASESYDKKQGTGKIFKKSFFLVFLACLVAVLIFLFFPKLIVGILFGKEYVEISNILIFVGLGFSFLSLSNLSLIYSLSMHKKRISFFVLFILLEILILSFFSSSLLKFSIGFMTINFIMFIVSLVFAVRKKGIER